MRQKGAKYFTRNPVTPVRCGEVSNDDPNTDLLLSSALKEF